MPSSYLLDLYDFIAIWSGSIKVLDQTDPWEPEECQFMEWIRTSSQSELELVTVALEEFSYHGRAVSQ